MMLVAIGRRALHRQGLGLEKVGVALDKRGRVITDHHFRTNVPGIYAIGDCREGADAGAQGRRRSRGLAESSPARPGM